MLAAQKLQGCPELLTPLLPAVRLAQAWRYQNIRPPPPAARPAAYRQQQPWGKHWAGGALAPAATAAACPLLAGRSQAEAAAAAARCSMLPAVPREALALLLLVCSSRKTGAASRGPAVAGGLSVQRTATGGPAVAHNSRLRCPTAAVPRLRCSWHLWGWLLPQMCRSRGLLQRRRYVSKLLDPAAGLIGSCLPFNPASCVAFAVMQFCFNCIHTQSLLHV